MQTQDVTVTLQPERLRMSYEDYLKWAGEDAHTEWVDGEVIIQMPPGTLHQNVVLFLSTLMHLFVQFYRLGEVLTAPYEMRVSSTESAREPDILFVTSEHASLLVDQRLMGPADLVVEIVSRESVSRDRGEKFYEYQESGIREYWVIDPRPGKERADFWILDASARYRPVLPGLDGVYRSTVIPGFWFDTGWCFGDERPDPLFCFAQIIGLPEETVAELRQIAARGPQV
jgi:Uma2 family endonuclease